MPFDGKLPNIFSIIVYGIKFVSMKKTLYMNKLWVFIIATFLISGQAFAQDVTSNVEAALSKGDATKLAQYFNQNIELIIDGPGKIYNKNQATVIVKDFFDKNKPDSFEKLHEGKKDNAVFLIGNIESGSKKYRVSILLKKPDDDFKITQIRIQNV